MDSKNCIHLMSDILAINDFIATKNPKALDVIFEKIKKLTSISSMLLCKVSKSETGLDFKIKHCMSFGIDSTFFTDYSALKMFKLDPIFKLSYNSSSPIRWPESMDSDFKNSRFADLLNSFGFNNGLAYTLKDNNTEWITYLCLSTNKIELGHYLFVSHLLPYLHNIVKSISVHNILNSKKISSREIEVLKWVARGKTYWEISKILNISERTIRFHISNMVDKLNANNSTHAISKAIHLNILSIY